MTDKEEGRKQERRKRLALRSSTARACGRGCGAGSVGFAQQKHTLSRARRRRPRAVILGARAALDNNFCVRPLLPTRIKIRLHPRSPCTAGAPPENVFPVTVVATV